MKLLSVGKRDAMSKLIAMHHGVSFKADNRFMIHSRLESGVAFHAAKQTQSV